MSWAYRHPIAVVSLFGILVLGGILSWPLLPVELLPSLAYPQLLVRTTYLSAAPEEIEALITRPVESALATTISLRGMSSVSTEGVSEVTLRFDWGTDMSVAAAEVREKLDAITESLPKNVKPPLVMHFDPSDEPVVTLALYGKEDPRTLRLWAKNTVKTELETLPGVAVARVSGGHSSEVQVLVDAARLAAHGVDLLQVANVIKAANINFPGGKIVRGSIEIPVRTLGRFTNVEQIRGLPVAHGEMRGTVRISDIATVIEGEPDKTSISRFNGAPSILISIIKEPNANIVEVSRLLKERVSRIQQTVPSNAQLTIADDQGPFIEAALKDLLNNVLIGGLLAAVVLLVGLLSVRRAMLVLVSIPVSILSTFGFMAFWGITINFMSIGGLAIGLGMLVDASIVVLESINRHTIRVGDIGTAVAQGCSEVNASVASGTFTTIAAMVPILFMTGLAQRLFRDFAFTLSCSLLISLLTAVALVPALVMLTHSSVSAEAKRKPSMIQRAYGWLLRLSLKLKFLILILCLCILAGSAWLLQKQGFQLLPDLSLDQFTIRLTLPPDSSIEALEQAVDNVESVVAGTPGVASFTAEGGFDPGSTTISPVETARPNEASIGVRIQSDGPVGHMREEALTILRNQLKDVPNVTVDFLLGKNFLTRSMGGLDNSELMRLVGDDLGILAEHASTIESQLSRLPDFQDIRGRGSVFVDQIQITVDRYKAAAQSISVEDVAETVEAGIKGKVVGKLLQGDQETDIRLRLRPQDRTKPDDLKRLPVSTRSDESDQRSRPRYQSDVDQQSYGNVVVLGQVAQLGNGRGPREILRTDRQRTVAITGNVTQEAFSTGELKARNIAVSVDLPEGYRIQPGAERFELVSSLQSLSIGLLVALLLTYAVMAVHFESIRWPIVILLALPMTIVGPSIIFNQFHIPITVLVLIGSIVLVGVVVNNGILMVDYINQLMLRGQDQRKTIVVACMVRLHPILMSTFTTVLAVLPICLGWGSGAELRKALGLTIAVGLIASLFFTLFLVPVLYELVAGRRRVADVSS